MNFIMNIEIKDKKIDVVSFLKGFSIITIVLMHLIQEYMTKLPSFIKTASSIGGTGVHVFFLCSGLGLYLSYLNKKTSFVEFIKKRFKKIYVPYIIIVLISFFLPWMCVNCDRVNALLSHIFLYKMFIPEYVQSFGVQFWFVSTIIQLYLLFIPLCLVKEKINNNKLFIFLCLTVSVIWWIFIYVNGLGSERVWSSFCLQYFWEFALGMVLAEYLKNKKKILINKIVLLVIAIIGILLQAVLVLKSQMLSMFNDIPALVGYTSLGLLLYNIPIIKSVMKKISMFSYELYLIHILVMTTIFYLFDFHSLLLQILGGVISLVICFILSYWYFNLMKKTVYNREP